MKVTVTKVNPTNAAVYVFDTYRKNIYRHINDTMQQLRECHKMSTAKAKETHKQLLEQLEIMQMLSLLTDAEYFYFVDMADAVSHGMLYSMATPTKASIVHEDGFKLHTMYEVRRALLCATQECINRTAEMVADTEMWKEIGWDSYETYKKFLYATVDNMMHVARIAGFATKTQHQAALQHVVMCAAMKQYIPFRMAT